MVKKNVHHNNIYIKMIQESKILKKKINLNAGDGIGVVLMQQGHLLSFISKALAPEHQLLLIYGKDMLAILFAINKWEAYLTNTHFII